MPPPASFLALGDSYTVGEGVRDDARWPAQLVARLRARGIAIADPRIIARTGWTTDELSAAMDAECLDPPYALVSLSIGVNNQYRGRPLDEYHGKFRALLQRAIALAGGNAHRAVVVSIPDWGVTPFARSEGRNANQIANEIDAFNAAAREATGQAGAHFIDITAISREPGMRDELTTDGLHPSGAQYARWVEVVAPNATAALRDR